MSSTCGEEKRGEVKVIGSQVALILFTTPQHTPHPNTYTQSIDPLMAMLLSWISRSGS